MPLAPSVPIFNQKFHQARADECFKQKFPLFTTIKVEIFVLDLPQVVSDEMFYRKLLHSEPYEKTSLAVFKV